MEASVMIDKFAWSFVEDSECVNLNTQIIDITKWLNIDTSSLFPDLYATYLQLG